MTHRRFLATFVGVGLAAASLLSLSACRRVVVEDEQPLPKPPMSGAPDGGSSLIDEIDQAGGAGGGGGGAGGGGGEGGGSPSQGGAGGTGGPGSDAGGDPRPDGGAAGNPDGGGGPGPSLITGVEVLLSPLTTINPPAVGSDGIALLHYPSTSQATAIFVDASRTAREWYGNAGAYYLYVAASGGRQLALLYAKTYPIHAAGSATELSGTPATYKEYLAVNEAGFAWVDYETAMSMPGGGRPMPGASVPGKIVFQTFSGTRAPLSDTLRYRARLDLSRTHVAFVEYAAAGAPGQVVVQALAGGPPIAAAPGTRHQDRPAIDGDWVVWEEYVSATDSVIRARNLVSGQVRDLSAAIGFRTNADLQGTRVVWEDQRAGHGDIYVVDLSAAGGERVAVSGKGHSAAPKLTADGLVWIETSGGTIGLVRARWAP